MATTNNKFRSYLHHRTLLGNKYTSGRLLVDAGSLKFPGAAVLAVGGARRGGAGYINYLSRETLPTELILRAYPDVVPLSVIADEKFDAILVGPGSPQIHQLPQCERLVIDGGALSFVKRAAPHGQIWVLTPHEGELRNMGFALDSGSNREALAMRVARELNAVLLLKGHHSIVATPTGIIFTDLVAGTELSTAGTGDVLAGLVSSMIASHRPESLTAAGEITAHAVEIFAAAAHSAITVRAPLVATDLLETIPTLLAQGEISL